MRFLRLLMLRQLGLAAKLRPSGHCSYPALFCPGQDQMTFKLSESPRIVTMSLPYAVVVSAQGFEAGSPVTYGRKRIEQVPRTSRESIQLCYQEVPWPLPSYS
jgi:hypothetical protein